MSGPPQVGGHPADHVGDLHCIEHVAGVGVSQRKGMDAKVGGGGSHGGQRREFLVA